MLPRTVVSSSRWTMKHVLSYQRQREQQRLLSGVGAAITDNNGIIEEKITIGFIGVGNMGLPMSLNLKKAMDSSVVVFDKDANALKQAEQAGLQTTDSLEDVLSSDCSVIFTMLPGCSAINQTMTSLMMPQQGMPSKLFIDSSTVSPSTSRYWHSQAVKNGHSMLDAPVSGGVRGAKEGTLTFMVGSPTSDDNELRTIERARPFLEAMGARVIPCGGPGTGCVAKLCNNMALAAQMIGIAEAMNLGEELGMDPTVLANVINSSTAKCWSSEVNNPHPKAGIDDTPATRDYEGGFASHLMLKDLGLAVSAGEAAGLALPQGAQSKELYRLAALRGCSDKDFGSILAFLKGN